MKKITLPTLLASTMFLVACESTPLASDGLPKDQYMVGGGFHIDYTAETPGNLIFANKSNGQIIASKSLKAGENFAPSFDPEDESITKLIGDLSEARLILYFIPSSPANPQP